MVFIGEIYGFPRELYFLCSELMRNYNALYYLLFILLITGAFASMAQNSYGLKIMGGVAFAFSVVFASELIGYIRKIAGKETYRVIELVCLIILSFLFGLRVFYIHFPYVEWIFAATGLVLLIVYFWKMITRFNYFRRKSIFLARMSLLYHLGLVSFLVSLSLVPVAPGFTQYSSATAILFLTLFLVVGYLKRDNLADGEKHPAYFMARRFKDHSILVLSIFMLFSLYVGLNRFGILPDLYADELPRSYYQMVNKAASKEEKPVEGKYRHELFKEHYDRFLKNIKDRE
jgi:hypothetical protein